jgi:hypothetical protein
MMLSLAKYYLNLIEKETRQSSEIVRQREGTRGIKRSGKWIKGERKRKMMTMFSIFSPFPLFPCCPEKLKDLSTSPKSHFA